MPDQRLRETDGHEHDHGHPKNSGDGDSRRCERELAVVHATTPFWAETIEPRLGAAGDGTTAALRQRRVVAPTTCGLVSILASDGLPGQGYETQTRRV
jgi:hypothetical protein